MINDYGVCIIAKSRRLKKTRFYFLYLYLSAKGYFHKANNHQNTNQQCIFTTYLYSIPEVEHSAAIPFEYEYYATLPLICLWDHLDYKTLSRNDQRPSGGRPVRELLREDIN